MHRLETTSALEVVRAAAQEEKHAAYVGLDVHKEMIEPPRKRDIVRAQVVGCRFQGWSSLDLPDNLLQVAERSG